ncbi:hypothetical protein MAL04_20085 (plasmid) [Leptospira noguchii]|nr:hypothetical protein MAL04_20085 [Leptospira noguchii]
MEDKKRFHEYRNPEQLRRKEPSKKEILEGIKQGFKEAKLHREGKIKLKSIKELLDEL